MHRFFYENSLVPDISLFKVRQGWLYVLEDTLDPSYLKVGRSSDLKQRLHRYNSLRPVSYCRFLAVAGCFEDVFNAESQVLKHLRGKLGKVEGRQEWFLRQHEMYILYVVEQAEKEFQTL